MAVENLPITPVQQYIVFSNTLYAHWKATRKSAQNTQKKNTHRLNDKKSEMPQHDSGEKNIHTRKMENRKMKYVM